LLLRLVKPNFRFHRETAQEIQVVIALRELQAKLLLLCSVLRARIGQRDVTLHRLSWCAGEMDFERTGVERLCSECVQLMPIVPHKALLERL
jgi:hypothetical protein